MISLVNTSHIQKRSTFQRPNQESFDMSYGGKHGLLVADGFKRYLDKRHAVRELEERKSQMV